MLKKAELTRLSVCACFRCVCARFKCVRGKLLTQRPTVPSILYARLVPSGSPYIESWYMRLNENAHRGTVPHHRLDCFFYSNTNNFVQLEGT